jgi:hypothetical protein
MGEENRSAADVGAQIEDEAGREGLRGDVAPGDEDLVEGNEIRGPRAKPKGMSQAWNVKGEGLPGARFALAPAPTGVAASAFGDTENSPEVSQLGKRLTNRHDEHFPMGRLGEGGRDQAMLDNERSREFKAEG